MKKITASILAMSVVATSMACPVAAASKKKDYINPPKDSATFLSLTYTNLFEILNSSEYYVSIKNVDTAESKVVARRDGDTYVSTVDKDGDRETKFVVDQTLYTVDDDEETVTVDVLNVPTQDVSVIDYESLKFKTSYEEGEYTVEQFDSGSNSEYYYFDNSGELVRVMTVDKKGNEKVFDVIAFEDEVPSDLFKSPDGYEIESAKYDLEDTRTIKLFEALLESNEYTLAFDSKEYSAVLVKNGYDYYANYSDLVEKTTTKQLALGAKVYTFDDAKKTYTEADRMYNDQIPSFFDTSRYELDEIEKKTEGKKTYLVETVSDASGIYMYYWEGDNLVKIETVNSSGKVLSTTTFKTYSATADSAALQLPSNYKLAQVDIGVGEGENEDTTPIEPTPVTTEAKPVEPTPAPAETTPVATAPTTSTTVTTTPGKGSPKTGNIAAIAAIPAALAAVAGIAISKKKNK